MSAALVVDDLSMSFGGLKVSRNISLTLDAGARVALIGPNGAGKTTFVNLVSGQLRPDAGRILIGGADVTSEGAEARVRRGLVRSFQISRLFGSLTVLENVLLAVQQRQRRTWRMLGHAHTILQEREALAILDSFGLTGFANVAVRAIAYGQQRLLDIAIAVALRPKILMLDEPAAGVSRAESPRIIDAINSLPAEIAVLMIEHDMDLVLRWAKRVVVLAAGAVIFDGRTEDVTQDARVREAYLGSYASAS